MNTQKHLEEERIEDGEGNWLISYADMMTLLVGFFVILLSFSKIDDEKLEQVKMEAVKEFGGIYQIPFGDLANRLKALLDKQGLGNQFVIKSNNTGVTISFYGAVFFDPGSVELKAEGQKLLDQLIPAIQTEAKDLQVLVEGHTDNVPVSSNLRFKSNWELSGIRASEVLEVFEKHGYDKKQLTAVGYGEARPIVPNEDTKGAAIEGNRAQNRRVVIKLIKPSENVLDSASVIPSIETNQK